MTINLFGRQAKPLFRLLKTIVFWLCFSLSAYAPAASSQILEEPPVSEFYLKEQIPEQASHYLVGVEAIYPPFTLRDEYGRAIGFEMDLIYAIATEEKFFVKVITYPWEGLLETLNKGERDIVISAISVTSERENNYDFTAPYFLIHDAFLTLRDSKLRTLDDIIQENAKIAVLSGSSQHAWLLAKGVARENIVAYDTMFLAVKAMLLGEVDVAAGDKPALDFHALAHADIATNIFVPENNQALPIAMVVAKGNEPLKALLNEGLRKIYSNGVYDKIYRKWFKQAMPNNYLPWLE